VFAVVLHFLCPSLTDLSFILERNDLAGVLLNFIAIGAVVGAAIATRGYYRTGDPES
jgi:hypothetical protein